MKPLVIFGTSDIGQLAHYYFAHDSDREVAGFAVDRAFLTQNEFCGLPVVPFDEITQHFLPQGHDLFVALSYSKLNQVRREKYEAGKAMGYRLANYVSSRATVLPGVEIGENCFILEDNTLQPFVKIGNNVTLWSGNHIGHHSKIHDHCFIASHVVVSGGVTVEESCFIGVNATLRDHITVGRQCVIGAGALILADTEPEGVYLGSATERSRGPSSRLRKI
jgi:sugar O-acyltransferase (sialic acid O-acetyltransferase NeuD family)